MINKMFNTAKNQPRWWFIGLFWGATMFVFIGVVFPFIFGDEITSRTLLRGLINCTFGAILFVSLLRLWIFISEKRKAKKL